MGRKIPAKKHRGVKDPVKQQERRLKSLKTKINAPPRDADEQPMPRSIIRLFGLEDQYPEKQKKHNKKKTEQPQKKDTGKYPKTNNNPVSSLKRMPGETGREFSRRINGAVRALHDGTDVQDYPVETAEEEVDVKGSFMESQARWRRRKAGKQAGKVGGGEEKPTRGQLLTQRKKAKKEALQAVTPELVYERVQFGDVAHAPPTLTQPRKAGKQDGAPRPGRRSLLLHSLLGGAGAGVAGVAGSAAPAGRLRDAPAAERRRRERARELAVAAYRALKNKPQPDAKQIPT